MKRTYMEMLESIRGRKKAIDQLSLIDDSFNIEWHELCHMEGSILRILKELK